MRPQSPAGEPRVPWTTSRIVGTYLVDAAQESPTGSRLSRFTVDRRSMRADRASEQIVLVWPSGGHNGGCVRFGPDGCLYLATGDASGIADQLHTGQDASDLPSSSCTPICRWWKRARSTCDRARATSA